MDNNEYEKEKSYPEVSGLQDSKEKTNPDTIVPYNDALVKSRKLGRVKGHLERNQRIAYNVFLKIAYDSLFQDPNQSKFLISIKDFCDLAGLDYHDYYSHLFYRKEEEQKSLEVLFRELQTKIYRVEWRNEKNEPYQVLSASLLSQFIMNKDKGSIEFAFPPFILESILAHQNFYILQLPVITGMRSSYSIALYEQILQRKEFGVWEVTVEDFKGLMGVEGYEYKKIFFLQEKVLKPAIWEINKVIHIDLLYIKIKKGRNIIAFRFIWNPKAFQKLTENGENKKIGVEVPELVKEPEVSPKIIELVNLFPENLKKDALNELKAWLKQYKFEDIIDAVLCAVNQKPNNLFAYITKILQTLPGSLVEFRTKHQQEAFAREKAEQAALQKKEQELLKKKEQAISDWWEITLRERLSRMPFEKLEVLRNEAIAKIKASNPAYNTIPIPDTFIETKMREVLRAKLESQGVKPLVEL